MSFTTPPTRNHRTLLRRGVALLALAAVALFSSASAQQLSRLLPQDTFAVFGVSGIGEHEAKFQPYVNEWERLGLTELFSEAFAEMDAGEDLDIEEALPAEFEGLNLFDFIGDEAWIAVSASRSNPLPAASLVARVSDAAAAALQQLWTRESAGQQILTEGSIQFSVDEAGEDPVAFAIDGNFLAVATNPDVLRGVLRRYQGAAEPSFVDSEGYTNNVAELLPFNVVFYFDMPRVVDLAQPFATGMGFDASVRRLGNALRTVGSYTSVTRITDLGLESYSRHVFGDPSLDPALHSLLTTNIPASTATLSFVDSSAVAYQASGWNPTGWWSYLSDLVGDLAELGIGPLDAFLSDNMGLSVSELLFDWMGSTVASVTPYTEVPDIGMASDNLLGDSLYLIETTDPAAAAQGLETLITMGSMFAGAFMDPFGEGSGAAAPSQRSVAGVSVDTYDLGQGFVIETAITGGYVLIATGSSTMDAALQANAAGGNLPPVLASLAGNIPSDSGMFMLQDGAASFRMIGQMLASQFGLYAGLVSTELNFDAAEAASEALGQYIEFLASRSGGQYSYSRVENSVSRGYGLTSINW